MQTEDTLSTQTQAGEYPWVWLTGEALLYICIGLLSLIVHLLWLGYYPLQEQEAVSALAAWRILHPGLALPAEWSPLLVSAQMALFGVFRATDFTARLLPAMAGFSLSILPSLWRRELGRIGALAAALLFAFSPAFLTFSRSGDGIMLAGTLCAWSFTLAYRALADNRPARLVPAAILLGLALAAAPNAYTWLLCAVIFAGAYYLRCNSTRRAELRVALKPLGAARIWLALALSWFLGATALLTNLAGLSQVAALPWRWLQGFAALQNPFGWTGMARNLLFYEPLLLALATYGAVMLFKRKSPAAGWLLGWFAVAALLSWLTSAGQPSWITDMLWPLAVLAALGTQNLWETVIQRLRRYDLIVLAPLTALIAFACFQLVEYTRVPDNALLAYAGVGLGLALLGWIGYRLWSDSASALRVGTLLLCALLACYTIRADSALLYQTGADPRESYAGQPVSLALRDMDEFISSNSSHLLRDARAATIAYPADLDPVLGWVLRDYSKATYADASSAAANDVQILPYMPDGAGPQGYVGQRFILRQQYNAQPLSSSVSLGWLLLRAPFGSLENELIEVWLAIPQTDTQP